MSQSTLMLVCFVMLVQTLKTFAAVDAQMFYKSILPDDLKTNNNTKGEYGYSDLDGLAEGSSAAQAAQKLIVDVSGLPLSVTSRKSNIRFRLIPPGSLLLPEHKDLEGAVQGAKLVGMKRALYVGQAEITALNWSSVMRTIPPSTFKDHKAVESVTFDEVSIYLNKLCELEGVPLGTYRLPSLCEWEYCRRAGTTSALYTHVPSSSSRNTRRQDLFAGMDRIAWYRYNASGQHHAPISSGPMVDYAIGYDVDLLSEGRPRDPAFKVPNAYGLYGMIGNVAEWVSDKDAAFPDLGYACGGGWASAGPELSRCALTGRFSWVGFRVVREISIETNGVGDCVAPAGAIAGAIGSNGASNGVSPSQ